MKKNLMFLLVLTAGTMLFAQEFKWSGYFNSGVGFVVSDQGSVTGEPYYLRAYAVDAGQNGYRFRLNGAWTSADENAGLNFRLQSQATIANGYFSLPYAYGWVKFLDEVLTLKGGIVDDVTWETGGPLLANGTGGDQGEGLGALLKISPLPGLDFGLGAYAISTQGGGANNFLNLPSFAPGVYPHDIKWTANLGYTLEGLFRVNASFRNASNPVIHGAGASTSRAILGFSLLANEDLTAILEVEANTINDFSAKGLISIYETLGYKFGDLQVGINAAEFISQASGKDFAVELVPWVSWAIGNVVPRLELVYFAGGSWNRNASGANDAYGRFAYTNLNDAKQDVLSIRPSVKFNLGSAFVELGDAIYFNNVFSDGANSLYNVVYVDLKVSF
jgi:hypothetical protein